MSRKMECPGCQAYTSSVASSVEAGEPCPYCSLSADAIEKVIEARRRHGETQLTADLTAALKRADRLDAVNDALSLVIGRIREALVELDRELARLRGSGD
jgi:hypothetical protein